VNWKCRPLKFRLKINVNFPTDKKHLTDLRGYHLLGCVVFCSSGNLPAFWKNTKANLVMTGYKGVARTIQARCVNYVYGVEKMSETALFIDLLCC
jgi:hypothetical protein